MKFYAENQAYRRREFESSARRTACRSLLASIENTALLEVGIVGREGMIGLALSGRKNLDQSRGRARKWLGDENEHSGLSRRMTFGQGITENSTTVHAFAARASFPISRLLSVSSGQIATRPLAFNDGCPNGIERISDNTGFFIKYARCAPRSSQ